MGKLKLPTPQLDISKANAGKESSLSTCCIALLYIYHLSSVIDFSSEKYIVSARNRYSLVAAEKIHTARMLMRRLELATPRLEIVVYVYHFSSVIDFSSENTLFLLDKGTPGTGREDTVRMLMGTFLGC